MRGSVRAELRRVSALRLTRQFLQNGRLTQNGTAFLFGTTSAIYASRHNDNLVEEATMFNLINSLKLLFCIPVTAFVMGCGTTATITRAEAPQVEGKIMASDSQNVHIQTGADVMPIARRSITDIDHPGNVAATIGAIVTGYGIANIAMNASDCDHGGAAYCTGVFLPAAIGTPIMIWGIATWAQSVKSAHKSNSEPEPAVAIVPTVSVDKKNEYVGVSAAMRF